MLTGGLLITCLLGVAACSASASARNDATHTAGAAAPISIVYASPQLTNPNDVGTQTGIKEEAKALGATVSFADANDSVPNQVSEVENAVASGKYQVIIINPLDNLALEPAVKAAITAGMKVVTVNEPIGPNLSALKPQLPGIVANVSQTAPVQGQRAGELVVRACHGISPCDVVYLWGLKSIPNDHGVTNGFLAAISGHPNIKVVSQNSECSFTVAGGIQSAQDLSQLFPSARLWVGPDQCMVGAQKVITGGKAQFIGISSASTQAVAGVMDGTWYGFSPVTPVANGKYAVMYGVAAARGQHVAGVGIDPASKLPDDGLITRSDISAFGPGEYTD
jgi:ribose transport system substrate-binding protein